MAERIDDLSAKRPTIYDIARVVGVSHQTVARVVKGHPNVGSDIRQRVEAAIKELGYRPNLTARSLATNRPHRLGALVYELLASGPSKIMEGASVRAREAGYLLDIVSLDPEDDHGISAAIHLMTGSSLAGIFVFTPTDRVFDAIKSASFDVPVVLESEAAPGIGDEALLGESGTGMIVDHLAELGHRRFFHISGPDGWLAARGRARAYQRAIDRRGLQSLGTIAGDWSAKSGYDAALRMPLDVGITALVAANDQTALGAMAALEQRGVDVPAQMSVVGFDDTPESSFFRPALTTVRFEFAQQGRMAIDQLIATIDGTEPQNSVAMPPTLIVRASSAPPPPD